MNFRTQIKDTFLDILKFSAAMEAELTIFEFSKYSK